jgi:hypothetical protein
MTGNDNERSKPGASSSIGFRHTLHFLGHLPVALLQSIDRALYRTGMGSGAGDRVPRDQMDLSHRQRDRDSDSPDPQPKQGLYDSNFSAKTSTGEQTMTTSVIQSLAQLETALKTDLKQNFGSALAQLFSSLDEVEGMTPLEIAVYDQGQLLAFGGQLAAAAVKFAPQAQQALTQFLGSVVASWGSVTAAAAPPAAAQTAAQKTS